IDLSEIVYETPAFCLFDCHSALLFVEAVFVVDLVLTEVLNPDDDDEGDERTLDTHVVAKREAQKGDGVQWAGHPGNDDGKDHRQAHDQRVEISGLLPVAFPGASVGAGHGISSPRLCAGRMPAILHAGVRGWNRR